MNNIFDYVTRREATESKLISGVNCSPESASMNSGSSRSGFTKRTAEVTTISCSRSHLMTTSLPRPHTKSA